MQITYNGLVFKSELEATWAAFFDLAGWEWRINPMPVDNWVPDFRVTFECTHSECCGSHTILIAVLPVNELTGVMGHPAMNYACGVGCFLENVDSGAIFGRHPTVSIWEMAHGAGGGTESVPNWVPHFEELWKQALCSVDGVIP